MKKIIVMLLVLALGLTGCGSNKENSKADATDVSSQTEDGVQEEETKIPEQVDITDFDKSGILEPQVLYDGDDMTFELSDFQYDDYFVGLQFHAVSKLDFPVTVDIASFALMGTTINGYTIESAASMNLSPEEPERYEWCYYSYNELAALGIHSFANISIPVFYEGLEIEEGFVYLGTFDLKTNLAENYDYETDTFQQEFASDRAQAANGYYVDTMLLEEEALGDSMKVLSKTLYTSEEGSYLMVELENLTDRHLNVYTSSGSLHGMKWEDLTLGGVIIAPHSRGFMKMYLEDSLAAEDLQYFGIDKLNQITMDLTVSDAQDSSGFRENYQVSMCIPDTDTEYHKENAKPLYEDESGIHLYQMGQRWINDKYRSKGYVVYFLCENTGSEDQTLALDDGGILVNGQETDLSWSMHMDAGTSRMYKLDISQSDCDELGINVEDDLTSLTFGMEVFAQRAGSDLPKRAAEIVLK